MQQPLKSTTTPRYPNVEVQLADQDGNALAIIARCRVAARAAGVPDSELAAFSREAMSGNYDHVLTTCLKWFTCH